MNKLFSILASAVVTVVAFRIADALVDLATEKAAEAIVKQKQAA